MKFGFWSKFFAMLLLLVAGTYLWLTWSIYFPPDYEEIIPVRLEGNGVSREFRIKRGLIDFPSNGEGIRCCDRVQSDIKLDVSYPESKKLKWWNHGDKVVFKSVLIFIETINPRGTATEQMINGALKKGDLPNQSPGRERYQGQIDGFDVYDHLLSPKTKIHRRSLVFKDPHGELVGVGVHRGTEAVMFGNLKVNYVANSQNNQPPESNYFLKSYGLLTTDEISNPNKPSHREMRDWVEAVVKSILVDTNTYPRTERVNESYGSNKPVSEK